MDGWMDGWMDGQMDKIDQIDSIHYDIDLGDQIYYINQIEYIQIRWVGKRLEGLDRLERWIHRQKYYMRLDAIRLDYLNQIDQIDWIRKEYINYIDQIRLDQTRSGLI